ncbi:Ubiquinone biosynthesis O-methyltransferase [Phycisphaerae bacterium RAS1]|nr:Ubiquinone biosynthesis O-methyltransferase [Phycisphaerae bacterium RAS1]
MKYRDRIFKAYATLGHRRSEPISLDEADRWGIPYAHYFRGWLPAAKDAKIVDLACGFGRLLRFFTKRGYTNVMGVDLSGEEVELARKIHPNVVQANLLDFLKEHQNEFDLITATDIIEHLTKDEVLDFLDGVNGALRPGGRVILQTVNADVPWGLMHRYHDLTHELAFNPHSIEWLLHLTGFSEARSRECGPVAHGVASSIRLVLWQVMRLRLILENLIETGAAGAGVMSRVFMASAVKR